MNGRRSEEENSYPLLVNSSNITVRRSTNKGNSFNETTNSKSPQLLANFNNSNSPTIIHSNNSINKLLEGLNNMSSTSILIKKQAEIQMKAINSMTKWAIENDNAAIDDVMKKTNEVFKLFSNRMVHFANEHETSIKVLKKIEQTEKAIKMAEKKILQINEQEKKINKDIKKFSRSSSSSFFKSKKPTDLAVLQHDLNKIKSAKINAEKELSDVKAEMEVIKMFRFRKGMEGISIAWKNFAMDLASIFTCQQELIDMVPAISTEDVREMVYEGSSQTSNMIEDLKEKLRITNLSNNIDRNYGRRSEPIRSTPQLLSQSNRRRGTPPPPYSLAVAPEYETSTPRRHSTFISPTFSEDSDYSSSSSTGGNRQIERTPIRIPINPNNQVSNGKLYPSLSPNPYKERLRYRNGGHLNYCQNHETAA
uniref:F-BAR domain-containing protein n=1 Tax=Strongyloides stercoralis TaxID=6248 RepID=A0A0K0DZA4_STRER